MNITKTALLLISASLTLVGCRPASLQSPSKNLTAKIYATPAGQLAFKLNRNGKTIIDQSPIGITINNTDLGKNVRLADLVKYAERKNVKLWI
jgi:hypothetical protein